MHARTTTRRVMTGLVSAVALTATMAVAPAGAAPASLGSSGSTARTVTAAAPDAGLGGAGIEAVGRPEGNRYNVYFDRSETLQLARGASAVNLLPPGTPASVRAAVWRAGRAIQQTAATASRSNSCVGAATASFAAVSQPFTYRNGACR